MEALLVDIEPREKPGPDLWPSLIVTKEEIDKKIVSLSTGEMPASGWREAAVVHPLSESPFTGLTPAIEVRICVVNPGECTTPRRHNATLAGIVLAGNGTVRVDRRSLTLERHDIWNVPGMAPYALSNDDNVPLVVLLYSNRPLLARLNALYEEHDVMLPALGEEGSNRVPSVGRPRAKDAVPPIVIGADGAALLQYEHLIDPDGEPSRPLHWPFRETSKQFAFNQSLSANYQGRRLFLLYNPATEKRLGITHSFFATLSAEPPLMVHTAHRHVSAAINYIIDGSGWSTVDGERMEWKAGDLHFSAPGWAVHHHASGDQGYVVLTVQDHPFHLANDSLIWQETLESEIRTLGSEQGFETNIAEMIGTSRK